MVREHENLYVLCIEHVQVFLSSVDRIQVNFFI